MKDPLAFRFGIIILVTGLVLIIGAVWSKLVAWAVGLTFLGWIGTKLYQMPAGTWKELLLKKVPLNLIFNPFYLILLLKSYTLLKYKDQLEDIDKHLKKQK